MGYQVPESLKEVAEACKELEQLIETGEITCAEMKFDALSMLCKEWMETHSEQEGSISLVELLIQYPHTAFEVILNFCHNL